MAFEKQHVKHCILFAFQLKKNATKATEMICSALGENTVSYKKCSRWYQKFRSGDFSLLDQERQLKKFENEELKQLLNENSAQTKQELALQLGVTCQCISLRLQQLEQIQKEGRWIPHNLSPEIKERRFDTAMSLLTRFKRSDFLHRIITGDEKWILYDNHKRRKLWADFDVPSTSTEKSNSYVKKILLCMWWDVQGVVYYELLDTDQAISEERYQQQLIHLNKALEQKRPYIGQGTRQVILQQDNVRPHAIKAMKDVICSLGWEILPHATYSPDLVPSDYHMFQSLQHHMGDSHFNTVEEIQESIEDFINSKPKIFFDDGISQLPERWSRVIDNNGDYFETEDF